MNSERRILVVEDDSLLREQLCLALSGQYAVAEAGDPDSALAQVSQAPTDLVLLDLQLRPNGTPDDGFAVLRELRRRVADTVVIVMTGDPHYETRMRAIEEGAYDCFLKPFDLTELQLVLRRSLERLDLERENRRLKEQVIQQFSFQNLIGCSPAMVRVFETIRRFADSPATVLLMGESGTGKELVARALHFQSGRRDAPFVAVHCSALPETLIETELFGHEKGAFTGAVTAREGRFEMAHRGTLFLDEVGTLNLNVQTKLLRVLDERQFERIGGRKTIEVDVRLIAASNEDLDTLVGQGRFRDDLFFRLNVLPLRLPALRERKEDIPLLVNHFLRFFSEQGKLPAKSVTPEALNLLLAFSWRGNVRELENVIQRAVLMADGETIQVEHLPPHISGALGPISSGRPLVPASGLDWAEEVARYEKELLKAALAQTRGVKTEAAKLLHLSKEQIKYLCRKYELEGNFSPEG